MLQTRQGSTKEEMLQNYIAEGASRGAAVVKQVMEQVPEDALVRAHALRFDADDSGIITVGPRAYRFHDNALTQAASRADIPVSYVRTLQGRGTWGRELLAENLTENYSNGFATDTKFLVRSVGGEARGFLSSKYRRMDSRPILDSLLTEFQKQGAVVCDGYAGDVRVSLTAILPRIFEPVHGDPVVFGVGFITSDFGRGALELAKFALRIWCLNGQMSKGDIRKVHLGARLTEDMNFRNQTYELDTRTLASATADVTRQLLSPQSVEKRSERIADAAGRAVDPKQIRHITRDLLTKADAMKVEEKFASADIEDLPPGQNVWRLSNAFSWLANQQEDGDKKLDLMQLSDTVMDKAA